MIGETLEVTIIVSMTVLIAYPSFVAVTDMLRDRRRRRVAASPRQERRRPKS